MQNMRDQFHLSSNLILDNLTVLFCSKTLSILSDDKYISIWNTIGKVAIEFFTFGASIMVERSDDFFTVERISKSFTLMETLEKEIDVSWKFFSPYVAL